MWLLIHAEITVNPCQWKWLQEPKHFLPIQSIVIAADDLSMHGARVSAVILLIWFYTMWPRQNGCHFADNIFKFSTLNKNCCIWNEISLKFVPEGLIDNMSVLVQIMAWHQIGDKPLSEAIMAKFTDKNEIEKYSLAFINMTHQLLLETEYSGFGGQYHACWWLKEPGHQKAWYWQHIGLLHCEFSLFLLNKIPDMMQK